MFWPQRPSVARQLSSASAPARSPTRSSTTTGTSDHPAAGSGSASVTTHANLASPVTPGLASGEAEGVDVGDEEGSASSPSPTVTAKQEVHDGIELGHGPASESVSPEPPKASSEAQPTSPPLPSEPAQPDGQNQNAHDRALSSLGFRFFSRSAQQKSSTLPNPLKPTSTAAADGPNAGDASKSSPTAKTSLPPLPTFPNNPENIYDPATGALAGVLKPLVTASTGINEAVSPPSGGAAASSSDNMWTQLAKIRELQSELSKMHFALDRTGVVDGLGVGVGVGGRRGATDLGFAFSSGSAATSLDGRMGEAEGGVLGTGDDVVEKELAKRKQNIGQIMGKLDQLSIAVTEFHSLPFPTLNFPSPSSETNNRAHSMSAEATASEQQRQRQASPQPSILSAMSSLPSMDMNYPPYSYGYHPHRPSGALGFGQSASYAPGTNTAASTLPPPPLKPSVTSPRHVPIATRTAPDPARNKSPPNQQHEYAQSPISINSPSGTGNSGHPGPSTRLSTLYEPPESTPSSELFSRNQLNRKQPDRLRGLGGIGLPSYPRNHNLLHNHDPNPNHDHDSNLKLTSATDTVPGAPPGIEGSRFQLTPQHESPSGTPTSLMKGQRLPSVEPGSGGAGGGQGEDAELDGGASRNADR